MNNLRLAGILGGCGLVMLGLAFASKPLYDTFCRVTGFGGTTQTATAAPEQVLDRKVHVRFDANVNGAPLRFRPLQAEIDIRLGEHGLAFYEIENMSDQDIDIIASYNVTPFKAGRFFSKLECFCFQEQVIRAGESRKLPVVFFIDPQLAEDRNLADVRTITLSYTYFEADKFEGTAQTAALR